MGLWFLIIASLSDHVSLFNKLEKNTLLCSTHYINNISYLNAYNMIQIVEKR
jgi:hypothetical protein